ncbi:hypothetical protein [Mycobacterium marinum]|uniref:hypothetical protein n=1 Tax=Mycobacterium marinum TaxID=1781 RepID=UPI002359C0C1|nr:hypothetical protein [Mycobacterium marinum]MDC9015125.1 hypothetical protein [Mycobacterium marinum]
MTGPQPGPVVVGGVVVLHGRWLDVALDALQFKATRLYRDTGLRPTPAHQRLEAALLQAMSASPTTDPDATAEPHTETGTFVTTKELAEMQGCSQRHARRLADKLDVRMIGRQKMIPLRAVQEHMKGKSA